MNPAERLVIVNAHAGGGKGPVRWGRLAPRLQTLYPHIAVVTTEAEEAVDAARAAAAAGVKVIVAAGGDGAVNALLNGLMDPATDRPRWDVALGAIGLGSSNDFHKPSDPARHIGGFGVAMNPEAGARVDVGRADWLTPQGRGTHCVLLAQREPGRDGSGELAL